MRSLFKLLGTLPTKRPPSDPSFRAIDLKSNCVQNGRSRYGSYIPGGAYGTKK